MTYLVESCENRFSRVSALFSALVLAVFLLSACAARKPGREYHWVPVYDASSCDGVTESYIGIGRKL